jgi:3-isopropylmalate/(R)-2-methylmalate dehydratase small subunit
MSFFLQVDLSRQCIVRSSGVAIVFDIDSFNKERLLLGKTLIEDLDCLGSILLIDWCTGLDDIGLTLKESDKITCFEEARAITHPWL